MKIAVACDHGGYPLKELILDVIQANSISSIDLGTHNLDSVDYPDYAEKIGEIIVGGKADRAIFLCGSGVGASIAANKIPGVYAGLCHDTYSAHQGVEHDNMNVLCLGARIVGPELAREIVNAFLSASFSDEPRHRRRFEKVRQIEQKHAAND